MQDAGYVFAAYTVIWAAILGYILVLMNRQKRLRREIDTLREAFKDRDALDRSA